MCLEGIVCEFERSPFALLQTNSPPLGIAYEQTCAVQMNINRHLPSIGHFFTEYSIYIRVLSLFNDFHVNAHHPKKVMCHKIWLKVKVILWIVLRVLLQSSHPMSLHASFSPLLQLPSLASCFYTIKIDACIEFQLTTVLVHLGLIETQPQFLQSHLVQFFSSFGVYFIERSDLSSVQFLVLALLHQHHNTSDHQSYQIGQTGRVE